MNTNQKRPNHGNYTSDNSAVALVKQMPIRTGLTDGKRPSHKGGATDVTIKKGSTDYAPGHMAQPSASNSNVVNGRHQKVQVSMPKPYVTTATNCNYMNSDRTNFLK